MTITFYKITDEKNSFPKNLNVERKLTMTGTLRDNDTSIISPEITFSGDITDFDYNYAYIEEFHRYYFIDEIISNYSEIFTITFDEDFLQSWATDILEQTAFVERCEDLNHANFRITDNNILVYPNKYTYAPYTLTPIHYQLFEENGVINNFQVYPDDKRNFFKSTYTENVDDKTITEKGYILLSVNVSNNFWSSGALPEAEVERIYPCSERLFFNNYTQAPGNSVTYIFSPYQYQKYASKVMDLWDFVTQNDYKEALINSFLNLCYVPFDIVSATNATLLSSTATTNIYVGNQVLGFNVQCYIPDRTDNTSVNCPIMAFDLGDSFKHTLTYDLKPGLLLSQDFRALSSITEWSINLPYFDSYSFNPLEWVKFNYIHVRYFFNYITSVLTCLIVGGIIPEDAQGTKYETLIYKQEKTIGETLTISMGGNDFTQRIFSTMLKTGLNLGAYYMAGPEWTKNYFTTSEPKTHTQQTHDVRASTARNKKTGRQQTLATEINDTTVKTTSEGGARSAVTYSKRGIGSIQYSAVDGFANALGQTSNYRHITSSDTPGAYNSTLDCTITRIEKECEFPKNYANLIGYICNNSDVLKNFKGYVKVGKVHLNIPALSSELEAIEDLLQSGVIINEVSE